MTARRVVQTLLALAFVAGAVAAVLVLAHGHRPAPEDAAQEGQARSAEAAGGDGLRFGAAVGLGDARREAMQVLVDWDSRRAAAYRDGDVPALRRLYAPGSRTGNRDVALLQAYVDRGLRVEDLSMQVLAFKVVRRGPRRLVLDVTDRVQDAVAVGSGERTTLPADRPEKRRVTLARRTPARSADAGGDTWQVVEVR